MPRTALKILRRGVRVVGGNTNSADKAAAPGPSGMDMIGRKPQGRETARARRVEDGPDILGMASMLVTDSMASQGHRRMAAYQTLERQQVWA